MSSLQFSRARDAELAWVDGQLHMNASESHVGLVLEDGELRDDEEGHEKMETDQSNRSGKEEPMDTVPVLEQLQLAQVVFLHQAFLLYCVRSGIIHVWALN